MPDSSMTTNSKQKAEAILEGNICEQCRKEEGLTFGYIGNFERWGDDRLLMIWVNEDKMRESNGNQRCLWRCPAAELVAGDAIAAMHVIKGFQAGKEYNSHQSC